MIYSIAFSSEIPDTPAIPLSVVVESEQIPGLLSGKRIAIVEDEGITQLQLSRILRSEGALIVATAADGKEAIDQVLDSRPDIVLMDIQMPIMDGLSAAERILAEYPVCIVMLTAFSGGDFKQRARQIGACGYVTKPIMIETLVPQVEAAFRKFQQKRQ